MSDGDDLSTPLPEAAERADLNPRNPVEAEARRGLQRERAAIIGRVMDKKQRVGNARKIKRAREQAAKEESRGRER